MVWIFLGNHLNYHIVNNTENTEKVKIEKIDFYIFIRCVIGILLRTARVNTNQ